MNRRMNRKRLNIGTYCLAPFARSEQHIQDLAACGIDFVMSFNHDTEALDLFEKYGVGAVVCDAVPGWWGGEGERAGKLREINPLSHYEEGAKAFIDHPAIWGIDIGDEPSALDFPYYGKVYSTVKRLFPNQFTYLNLYPSYASVAQNTDEETVSQLGTTTYEEYIEQYCRFVPSEYICFDYYPYSTSPGGFYTNLRIVGDAARNHGRSMWIVLQVNSNDPEVWVCEDQLRFQAYVSMAFGAENLTWACYAGGWWYHWVLDDKGEKTEQYDKLKTVNAEIRGMAEDYMRYRRTETHFVGFSETDMTEIYNSQSVDRLDTGAFYGVHADRGTPLVIGEMVSRGEDDGVALMIAVADHPYGEAREETVIRFTVEEGRTLHAYCCGKPLPLTKEADGSYAVAVASNQGILITAK